jgi:protein-tyrosine phosphatase
MRLLFFCMGNICRSPVARAVAERRFAEAGLDVVVDSAGTEGYHVGEHADPRTIASARAAGYDVAGHRARQLAREDFERYDWLLGMDRVNLRAAQRFAPESHAGKLPLFLAHAGLGDDAELPDPYYGGPEDFRRVIALAEAGADGLIARLR